MNYFAQALSQGAQIGAAAYDARKRRDQEAALEKARRELQLELDTRRTAAERALQEERLVADAKKQFADQNFRKEEGATERGWRTNERKDEQGFRTGERESTQKFTAKQGRKERNWRSSESTLDRTQRQDLANQQLDAAAAQFAKKYELESLSLQQRDEARNQAKVVDDVDPTTNEVTNRRITRPFDGATGPSLTPAAAAATPPKKGAPPQPPEQAIKFLRANPQTAAAFDELFGRGAAARILGSR